MTMLYENFRLALFSLKANKMRALLTMLGIIIGISSVIAIMTIGDGLAAALAGSMSELGANNVEVGIQYREFGDEGPSRRVTLDDLMTLDMVSEYYEMYSDEIKAIQIVERGPEGKIVDGNLYANVSIYGQNTPGFAVETVNLEGGRYFTKAEMDGKRKVCMISKDVVNNMFKGKVDSALGQTVTVETAEKNYQFTVVGVYSNEDSLAAMNIMGAATNSKDKQTTLYVPLLTAMEIEHSDERITNFMVLTEDNVDQKIFSGKTKRFMNRYYEGNDLIYVEALAMASMVETVTGIMNKITIGISVIAGIALLVGGIGVMNIMLVSITERTREIGTRKALGAPNSSIRMQFIIESVVICVIGGIIGIVLGCSLGMLAIKFISAGSAAPSIRAIVISLGFSTAIGVFFGYYPANKAAKMDPIEALRYE